MKIPFKIKAFVLTLAIIISNASYTSAQSDKDMVIAQMNYCINSLTNIINNKSNNKSIYCLFLNKEESSHNNCANNKMFSLYIDKFATLNYVKNNLSNGSLFLINNTQELNNIIEYILSKGYKIVPLSSLITE